MKYIAVVSIAWVLLTILTVSADYLCGVMERPSCAVPLGWLVGPTVIFGSLYVLGGCRISFLAFVGAVALSWAWLWFALWVVMEFPLSYVRQVDGTLAAGETGSGICVLEGREKGITDIGGLGQTGSVR